MKVYIAYGWPEGNWHGKKFRDFLINNGYRIASSPEEADAIVAHSAGCYTLPSLTKAKVVLLVGLPNWPNKPLIKCTIEKVSLENKDKLWFQKTLWHIIYAIFQPVRIFEVYKSYKRKSIPSLGGSQVVILHNHQDAYMNEPACRAMAKVRNWQYKNLDGQHDDLWQNPQPYINIIKESTV